MGEPVKDVILAADGRLVLPEELLRAIGITGETVLAAKIEGGAIRLEPASANSASERDDLEFEQRIRRAQELFRTAVGEPFSSDDFLATRERD